MITAVVLKSRSDVKTSGAIDVKTSGAMRGPGSTSRWFIVNEDFDASRGDGVCTEIMGTAVKTRVRRDGWIGRVR